MSETEAGPAQLPWQRGDDDPSLARHRTHALGTHIIVHVRVPREMSRRDVGNALACAVAELRAVDAAFGVHGPHSLVRGVRRGDLRPGSYPPPLCDVMTRCTAMHAATEGWFNAWANPAGFDPGGFIKGWAVDRAATLLLLAGVRDFSITAGADRLTYRSGQGTAYAVSGGSYPRHGTPRVVDPHTGGPAHSEGPASVTGCELATANAYAVALYAAAETGLRWFPTNDGYRVLMLNGRPVTTDRPLTVA